MILPVSFYSRPTLKILQDLIGMVLTTRSDEGLTSGVIVEAEAYRGEDDPASFAFRGRTRRSGMLYGPPGRAFVYLTYGKHYLLNVVTERENFPAAVLIRAVQPREGISLMRRRRKTEELTHLCSGPGRICQAFGIDLRQNGAAVTSPQSSIVIQEGDRKEGRKGELVWNPRIGIREGKDRLWRVYLRGNPFVSKK